DRLCVHRGGHHAVGQRDPWGLLGPLPRAGLCQAQGGQDDDRRGVHLRHLLAALPRLLPPALHQPRPLPGEVHSAGLPGGHVAGHELHHVQPHHLLLPQRQVPSGLQACLPVLPLYQCRRLRGARNEIHPLPPNP
ncbi:unnamed protein product, partial [Gulo gulo]